MLIHFWGNLLFNYILPPDKSIVKVSNMSKRQARTSGSSSTAVIYARYSSNAQREESIEGQLRECHEFAKRNNLQVINEYVDKAMTGRTDKRPSFLRMVADSSSHKFQYVICWKLDRFSRDRYDSAVYKHKLKKNGVKVIYAKESIPEGPEGTILESVMEGLAEYYSQNLAQNVKRGLTDSAMQLQALGLLPFGYRKGSDGRYELDPATSPAAVKIFRDYAAGVPAVEICEELNAAGFKTSHGKPFSRSSIVRMIRNERYVGVYIWDDVREDGAIPAITDRETWEACQRRADANKKAPAASRSVRYILTGKIRCGECGENMIGESCRSKSGKLYYYYTCYSRKNGGGCKAPRLKKEEAEEYVSSVLADLVSGPHFFEDVADAVIGYMERESADTSSRDSLTVLLSETAKKHENILKAIEMGVITEGTKARLLDLEAEMERIRAAIAQEDIKKPALTREHIIYFFEKMGGADLGEQLIDTFLNAVFFYPDHVDFCLNYTKNAEPVSFTDYRSALSVRLLDDAVDWLSRKANIFVTSGTFIFRIFK